MKDGEQVVIETNDPTRALNDLTTEALASGVELERLECGDRRSRTFTSTSSIRTAEPQSDPAPASTHVRAARLRAKPRGGRVHLHLPAAPLRSSAPCTTVRSTVRRPSTCSSPGSSATEPPIPRSRDSRSSSSAGARLACSSDCVRPAPTGDVHGRGAPLDAGHLRLAVGGAGRTGTLALAADPTPANWLGFVGAIVLGVACFAGLGLGAAALIRSAEGVSAVVNVIVLPMAFLSGSFGPTDEYPALLEAVADVLPLTYFLDIVYGVYLDGESLFADGKALAVVAAWGVAASRSPCGGSAGCRAER